MTKDRLHNERILATTYFSRLNAGYEAAIPIKEHPSLIVSSTIRPCCNHSPISIRSTYDTHASRFMHLPSLFAPHGERDEEEENPTVPQRALPTGR